MFSSVELMFRTAELKFNTAEHKFKSFEHRIPLRAETIIIKKHLSLRMKRNIIKDKGLYF